jgi:8-oxo-dGTP pyrophosphatase MutT (NUDIX family)
VLRTSRQAHVTASTLVLDPEAGTVLLTLHWKVGRWLQLGGHCEPGDAGLLAAAAREAQEESGLADLVVSAEPIRLDRHVVRCRADGSEGTHLDVQFVATASSRPPLAPTFESLELRWWPVDALPADTDDSVRALVRAALSAG